MTWSVNQHWDPLKVCVVGRSYSPEYYSWIKSSHVRNLFEKIAFETEEDYQAIIKKLESFGVQVLRPEICHDEDNLGNKLFEPPPMTPRDYMVMIGEKFYNYHNFDFAQFYKNVRHSSWPDCKTLSEFYNLPEPVKQECLQSHNLNLFLQNKNYNKIFEHVKAQGNDLVHKHDYNIINGAMVTRLGKDLYFGTNSYDDNIDTLHTYLSEEFPEYRIHFINTGGHSDGVFCAVCPGLIVSSTDITDYSKTFPDWEVFYQSKSDLEKIEGFRLLKQKNKGRWWIPNFENDTDVIDLVESYLSKWVGYVEETVFDVNILIIDHKNVMVVGENEKLFNTLQRYGITAHVVPFRHRFFWDGGIHCNTVDLHREGILHDYFPERNLS